MKKAKFFLWPILFSFALNACAKTDTENLNQAEDVKLEFVVRSEISSAQESDINGDGKKDLIENVVIADGTAHIPANITVVSPWPLTSGDKKNPAQIQGGSQNNLLITLSNSKQFLIHDVNDVSLLDTDAAKEIYVESLASLEDLELPELNKQAKGDVIVIPTEAGIDIYLFWNGVEFQVYEPLELP